MKISRLQPASLAAAISLLFALLASARADVKNFTFRGTIDQVDDNAFLLDGSVTEGAPFEGFYIFDSAAADSNADSGVGDYPFTDSTFGVVLKVGNYVFRTNPRHVDFLIEVVNRPGGDNYLFRSYHNVCSQPIMVGEITWQLDDPTGAALTAEVLPSTPPVLAAWQSLFGLTVSGGCDPIQGFLLRGTVQSISEAPPIIPERPEVAVERAVEVKWPSRLGYFYQVQSSQDLETWTNVGEPILGDGTELSKFFPRPSGRPLFYRAEIANFPR